MKTKVWIYLQNCGDGSSVACFFNTCADAEAYAEGDEERNCDDIYYKILDFDSDGKLLNASKLSDRL